MIDALAAESQAAQPSDKMSLAQIDKGRKLIADKDQCARCHHFHDAGQIGVAPDLTGYGSRSWIIGVLADPTHSSFYGPGNDRMPAYVPLPAEPKENRLQPDQIGLGGRLAPRPAAGVRNGAELLRGGCRDGRKGPSEGAGPPRPWCMGSPAE